MLHYSCKLTAHTRKSLTQALQHVWAMNDRLTSESRFIQVSITDRRTAYLRIPEFDQLRELRSVIQNCSWSVIVSKGSIQTDGTMTEAAPE